MIYAGIDIASEKHDCCILSDTQAVLKQFSFSNDADGFALLIRSLSAFAPVEEIKIGLESTGNYGNNLSDFLRRKGYETSTFNPLLIKKSIQATTLRKTKTDKADAKFLALYLMQKQTQPDLPIDYHTSELKSLSRTRFSFVQNRSALKTKVKGLLIQLFPEFRKAFSDVFGASAVAVLEKYPSAAAIAGCEVGTLAKLIQDSSRGRLAEEKAEALRALAVNSIGVRSEALEIELCCYLEQIRLLTKHIRLCEEKIKALMKEINSPITTVPGIGFVLGAMILAEIGDINRFGTPAKLLAFAGLDPSVNESGKSVNSTGSMVKRGSKYLRWAFGQAARCVSVNNPVFQAYLDSKIKQGKHYSIACSHVAKKLCRVLFAILRKNTPYSLDYALKSA